MQTDLNIEAERADLPVFEIWSEGYLATGMDGIPSEPHLHGKQEGDDFVDACKRLAEIDPEFREYFEPEHMTFWGCRLYPTKPVGLYGQRW